MMVAVLLWMHIMKRCSDAVCGKWEGVMQVEMDREMERDSESKREGGRKGEGEGEGEV